SDEELAWSVDEGSQDGDQAPGNHDAGDPFAGAPTLDDDGAGNFEDQIAEEEHAGAETVDPVAEVEDESHVEGDVHDIDGIQEIDYVEDKVLRHEACEDAATRAVANVGECGGCRHESGVA